MSRKILITGGSGMLASQIEKFYINKGDEVFAPRHADLDVMDKEAVKKVISRFKPDCVFHTAALHVDDSENNPELAYRLNTWASENLALICDSVGVELVYISSCGYFGDEKKYYSEYDDVVLKTVYARSKYQGEVAALSCCKKTFAIRPGWLFGGSIKHKKNFVYQRYLEAKGKDVVNSASDKFGSPTFVDDLASKMDEIIQTKRYGLYHVTNGGGGSRADYVKKIIDVCGLDTKMEPVDSSCFPRKANVPCCEFLHNWNLKYLGLAPMPHWEEAIERYVRQMMEEIGNA